ncbi:MAG TPA: alpha-isopropylmalate synthase regulatory domain-containing protein [Actinomycetota bacterium]|jgi:2-isopropylmalate synthase|nr:alpha-isopropylmalate synthase regulatory domain-containing protein [Actinomycetota bacterium]
MKQNNPFFEVCGYKVISERMHETTSRSQAIVEVQFGHDCVRRAETGVGPVHALDRALRACLQGQFPELEHVRLADYRVGVVDASDGTGAQVRVLIEATDGTASWDAGCVSDNIIDASFEALCSTAVMGIMRARATTLRSA